ncbi:MAG: hypothetical protein HQK88_10615 [Nitrospirae bacterium]|nr:hypothetical protein [Nitrospirota bacterium]MBF0535326.1 hypothetical protein [Nitrospirota bacterium]MBF0617251.1 hypothetical protein [Nitrospirota bacterium]
MAQDEGLFGRINNARRAWAPPVLRPKAPRQYVFAAICPALGKMTALILPYANTETMNISLRQVSIDFQIYFMIIVVDLAAWHMSKNLVVPENIRLIPQPAPPLCHPALVAGSNPFSLSLYYLLAATLVLIIVFLKSFKSQFRQSPHNHWLRLQNTPKPCKITPMESNRVFYKGEANLKWIKMNY